VRAGRLVSRAVVDRETAIDTERQAALFEQYAPGLLRFVQGILRDRQAAEDVVQTTFLKASQKAAEIDPPALKTWLYRVACNDALSRKRQQETDRRAREELARKDQPAADRPDERLVRQEVVEQVRQVMQELSPQQQRVVRLRVYEEKTFAQIAEEIGTPLGTVLTHMRRAMEKMRQKLQTRE
jgi:RNA polymerase sigma factor (sigma-70 family)